jgi:hypothetical protein
MTDTIANQNGGVKPEDINASGPSSTDTPNSGPSGESKTGPPKRRLPKKGPPPNTSEVDSQPKKTDSATSSTGNENTVPKANSEVGNATGDGSKKTRKKNKNRRKKKKNNPTDGADDAKATEAAGEKTQEPQKDEPEIIPPVVDGEETPRGKEGKLSRKQRRNLKTPQGDSVSATGTIDSETTATGSQPESGVLPAGAPAKNVTATQEPGEKEQNMTEVLDGEPRGKDGKLSRKQRRLLRETVMEEVESPENTPTESETATTEAANDAKQEPIDTSSKVPGTLPVVVQSDTSTDNQGLSTAAADEIKEIGGDPLSAAVDKAILETLEASLSAPNSFSSQEEETNTANRDIAFNKVETSADTAKKVETRVEAAPKKKEKAETKTMAVSSDLVVETQEECKAKSLTAYEDDNTGKKDDCECSGCIIS